MLATGAAARLPAGSLATAASAGLQDSAPRAAQLALHARVTGVQPDAWEHPSLAQLWFRWADYLVPRAELGLFTIGTLPRAADQVAALEQLVDLVLATIDGCGENYREVRRRLQPVPYRSACVTGRVLIRWDARTVSLEPCDPVVADPSEARRGLARRFVHCYGPVGPRDLAKWAWIPEEDALRTWDELRPELVAVGMDGCRQWMLAADVDALGGRAAGVRLLPMGDPVLYVKDADVGRAPPVPRGEGVTSRLVNSLTGRLLVDGEVAGSWGRVRGDVTIHPWWFLDDRIDDIEREAAGVAAAVGHPLRLRWLDR